MSDISGNWDLPINYAQWYELSVVGKGHLNTILSPMAHESVFSPALDPYRLHHLHLLNAGLAGLSTPALLSLYEAMMQPYLTHIRLEDNVYFVGTQSLCFICRMRLTLQFSKTASAFLSASRAGHVSQP